MAEINTIMAEITIIITGVTTIIIIIIIATTEKLRTAREA